MSKRILIFRNLKLFPRTLLSLFFLQILSCCFALTACGQEPAVTETDTPVLVLHPSYSFLKMEYNILENDSIGMASFYSKLSQLEKGQRKKLVVVHIGDSHLQADFFSGRMRTSLQSKFGVAGRGLVFPYRVAGTNSPYDIKSSSSSVWEAKRNVYPAQALPIGVSGITIRTVDSNFVMQLSIAPNDSLDYSFDKVTVYCERGTDCYDLHLSKATGVIPEPEYSSSSSTQYHVVTKGQTLSHIAGRYGCSVTDLQRWNNIRGTLIYPGQKLAVNKVIRVAKPIPPDAFHDYSVIPGTGAENQPAKFLLDEKVTSVFLRGSCSSPDQKQCTIYGVELENSSSKGILYDMIGVNGAKFEHYNVSSNFASQLAMLKPDLVIVSLGTNETMDTGFRDSLFKGNAVGFFNNITSSAPGASILITTPADNNLRRRYSNPRPSSARDVLREIAVQRGYALWNFYDLMGGLNSILQWNKAGLANYDKVHFTKAGYELQGDLLFQSIMKSYSEYQNLKK